MRVGRDQLRTLIMCGSPTMLLLTEDRASRALVKRGLLRSDGRISAITPAGLRVLANEMEAGRVADALERMKRDAAAQKARAEARRDRR